jgi:hypothetical protein
MKARSMFLSNRIMTTSIFPLLMISFCGLAHADRAKIQGDYCYQYGDNESLMAAKEISRAMALRRAVETYKTFLSSTSCLKDLELKGEIIETIASGYVGDIKIISQDVQGRRVCTTLVGHVDPETVKCIISRKVNPVRETKKKPFKRLPSDGHIKILNYKKTQKENGHYCLSILFLAISTKYYNTKIVVDCFDINGDPMEGTSEIVNACVYSKGETTRIEVKLPLGAVTFELRLEPISKPT